MSRTTATLIGFVAVLLWGLLALFTAASGKVPPFQLSAMTFAIGGVIGVVAAARRPGAWAAMMQPWQVWTLGVAGLFGYHFLYYTALRNAPPVEAGLIAYLWPLLIILFSTLLPGERLKSQHILGGMMGLAGAALIAFGKGAELSSDHVFGYAMAALCALTWSGYSVLSRLFAKTPTDIVTGFCLATSGLSVFCHLLIEETVWPSSATEWLAVIGLGLGPVGLAFYVWDYGVKHGSIQVLGAASYMAPLLSTLVLVATGFAEPSWEIGIACLLITAGAAIAAKDMLFKRRQPIS